VKRLESIHRGSVLIGRERRRDRERTRVPSRDPRLGEVLEFMRVTWALDHALHRGSKRMRSNLGVTGPQRFVIRIVGRFPDLTAGRLAALLHLHPSTLTGVLRRLEAQGLLRRRADPVDRRRCLVVINAKGRRLNVETAGTIEAGVRRALHGASPRQLEAARELLSAIARELEEA
jgi:DNA-binding MarR family transcriptional regulator